MTADDSLRARFWKPAFVRAVCVSMLSISLVTLRAERFQSVAQAQALCYAEADRFEARTVTISEAQLKAIQAATGQSAANRGYQAWVAWRGTNLLGVLIRDRVAGERGPVDYVVAIAPKGAIHRIEILEYSDDHADAFRGAKWREQFQGKSSKDRLRLNEDLSGVTGAATACRNLADGIRRLLATYDRVVLPALPLAPDPGPRRVPFASPR